MATMIAPARRVKTSKPAADVPSPEGRSAHAAVAAGLASFRPAIRGDGFLDGLSDRERAVVQKAGIKAGEGYVTPYSPFVQRLVNAAKADALRTVLAARPRFNTIAPVCGGRELPAASVAEPAPTDREAERQAYFAAFRARRQAEREALAARYRPTPQVSCFRWASDTLADKHAPRRFREIAERMMQEDALLGQSFVPPVSTADEAAEVAASKSAARPKAKPAPVHPMNHPARLRTTGDNGEGWHESELCRIGRRAGHPDREF